MAAPSQAQEVSHHLEQTPFAVSSKQTGPNEVIFDYRVPTEHALERANFRFQAPMQTIDRVIYPPVSRVPKSDHAQYRQNIQIRVLLKPKRPPGGELVATAQGCDLAKNICYPPFEHAHRLK